MFGLKSRKITHAGIPIANKLAAVADVINERASVDEVIERECTKLNRRVPTNKKAAFAVWRATIIQLGREGNEEVLKGCEEEGIIQEKPDRPNPPSTKRSPAKKP